MGNEINSFLGSMGSSSKPIPTVITTPKVAPTASGGVTQPTLPSITILTCKCGKVISVGKTTQNVADVLTLKCPDCGTVYKQTNYEVDPTSKVFHRPFDVKAAVDFDKEVATLKKSLKFEEKLLK